MQKPWSPAEKFAMSLATAVGIIGLSAIYPGWVQISLWAADKDAPAWVQAVGSVLAIIAAAMIASWQTQRAERQEARRLNAQMRSKMLAVRGLLEAAAEAIEDARNAMSEESKNLRIAASDELDKITSLFGTIPIFEIPGPDMVTSITNVSRQLRMAAKMLRHHASAVGLPPLESKQTAVKYLNTVSTILATEIEFCDAQLKEVTEA